MYFAAVIALLSLAVACAIAYVASKVVTPSPIELEMRTISREFEAWKKGATASLVIETTKPGIYEVGFEFAERKLERGNSFEGLLRVDVFEDGNHVLSREITGDKRGYYADGGRSYRRITLADFELPVVWGAKESKLVVTVVGEDEQFIGYPGMKLFVRPLAVK